MSFFELLKKPDINEGVELFRNTEGAVLIDVRTPREYRDGHIPGSKNVPLQFLEDMGTIAEDLDTPVFVYCQSGARSRQAAAMLDRMGYRNVKNLGGIAAWNGETE